MKHRVIGIDLGTTYSAVAVWDPDQEQAVLIPDESGNPTTPSVVAYDPLSRKVTVGHAAKRNLHNNPDNTVIEIKREMGEKFRPETLEKVYSSSERALAPRREIPLTVNDPLQVYFAGEWRFPQEISAFTLMRMKAIAEQELGGQICDAVITVPAYFKSIQKKATEEAAFLAGLYPRQLIPEPTAAAICYGVDRFDPMPHRYLVYDLGGGTFDVSIISVEGESISVIATSGDPRLGGGDFDDEIVKWAVEELKSQLSNPIDAAGKARIKQQAEEAKIQLSTHPSVTMAFPEFQPQKPPVLTLTREVFEAKIQGYVQRSLDWVEQGLKLAKANKGVDRDDISAVLLVGGSSQIPLVRSTLMRYFDRDESFIRSDLDPAAVVARGAARLAGRFAPTPPPFDIRRRVESLVLNVEAAEPPPLLITEHTLGIAAQAGGQLIFCPIVPQGRNIPVSAKRGGYTNPPPQPGAAKGAIHVDVYQGESEILYENTLVGSFVMELQAAYAPNSQHFEVTMSLDQNGLLTCTVLHVETGSVHRAEFSHKCSLGGPEALAMRREDLLALFASAASAAPPKLPEKFVPPAPSSQQSAAFFHAPLTAVSSPASPAAAVSPAPSATSASPATPAANTVAAGVGGGGSIPGSVGTVGPQAAPSEPPTTSPALIQISVAVPEQFQGTVRRARKELLRQASPELILAFNAFATALNSRQPTEAVEDLGDQLENVYHDARSGST